ncbi:MAG: hypothetical protein Q4B43_03035 [Bacteroidota bacterium]|nr:hypothetical protein [Bacteroidota bacterium]
MKKYFQTTCLKYTPIDERFEGCLKVGYVSHFLWNAKMRFRKTFTSYQLALQTGWHKVLVLKLKHHEDSPLTYTS